MTARVETETGTIEGLDGPVRCWRGVPFAAAPVGAWRWRPPAPAEPWSGTRDATSFGADPVQKPNPGLRGDGCSEDCLTLNIWAPADAEPGSLPVMVWLYGGGFIGGSGSSRRTDGTRLASRGVVVVEPNYRVGVFGFLAHPELTAESDASTSGNYGLLDQIAALRWVQRNIRAFGGDPDAVTLFGVSAGAACISLMMTMPSTEGLFHRAILQSPGSLRPLSTLAEAEGAGARLGSLGALRAAGADELLRFNNSFGERSLVRSRPLRPIFDSTVVPAQETDVFARGAFRTMPMIVGNAVEEGRFFRARLPVASIAELRAALERDFDPAAVERLMQLYPAAGDDDALVSYSRLFADTQFNLGVRDLAALNAKAGTPTYRYLFAREQPGGEPATHTDDTAYVFGQVADDAPQRAASDALMAAWTRFAQTGDPNGGALPSWGRCSETAETVMIIDETQHTVPHWRDDVLSGLRSLLPSG